MRASTSSPPLPQPIAEVELGSRASPGPSWEGPPIPPSTPTTPGWGWGARVGPQVPWGARRRGARRAQRCGAPTFQPQRPDPVPTRVGGRGGNFPPGGEARSQLARRPLPSRRWRRRQRVQGQTGARRPRRPRRSLGARGSGLGARAASRGSAVDRSALRPPRSLEPRSRRRQLQPPARPPAPPPRRRSVPPSLSPARPPLPEPPPLQPPAAATAAAKARLRRRPGPPRSLPASVPAFWTASRPRPGGPWGLSLLFSPSFPLARLPALGSSEFRRSAGSVERGVP